MFCAVSPSFYPCWLYWGCWDSSDNVASFSKGRFCRWVKRLARASQGQGGCQHPLMKAQDTLAMGACSCPSSLRPLRSALHVQHKTRAASRSFSSAVSSYLFNTCYFFVKGKWGKSLEISFFWLFVTTNIMGRNPFLTLNKMTSRCRVQNTEQNKMVPF